MKLFILRHGEAEGMKARDEDRELTARGRQDVAQVIEANQEKMQGLQRILVSPYLRAQQTAEIVNDFFPDLNLHTTPYIVPEGNPIELIRWLKSQCFGDLELDSVLMVSHQPLVGTLVNELCGKESGYHSMGTANLASLSFDILSYGLCDLEFLARPSDA